jgi:hypothetical protein
MIQSSGTESVRALFSGIVDYAGLFPPAALPLDAAIRMFDQSHRGTDAWMLGGFVCPAARLDELITKHGGALSTDPPASFAVLGRNAADSDSFIPSLRADLDLITSARSRAHELARFDSFEVKLPSFAVNDLASSLSAAAAAAQEASVRLFIELPLETDLHERLAALKVAGLAAKFRTGGISADAFPSTEALARALGAAARNAVPLKCTAGLHHPLRHFNTSVNTKMHGFVNVFVAGIMARRHEWPDDLTRACLEEEDPKSFDWREDGLGWHGWQLSTKDILAIRRDGMLCFGSCSFDEPLADLRALGWL